MKQFEWLGFLSLLLFILGLGFSIIVKNYTEIKPPLDEIPMLIGVIGFFVYAWHHLEIKLK